MDPNELIVDEAGEEEMNPLDSEHDERDTGNTNEGKEQVQEGTEMQQVETEETLEENAIEEALQGVYLETIEEEWKLKGINAILKQRLQKIEGDYLLQEELKLKAHHIVQESTISKGILANVLVEGLNLKGSGRKRGRKTSTTGCQAN